jgi:hypothetical protein
VESIEQAVKQQVKAEIGDDENIKFAQKNQLNLKFGLINPTITPDEIALWEELNAR